MFTNKIGFPFDEYCIKGNIPFSGVSASGSTLFWSKSDEEDDPEPKLNMWPSGLEEYDAYEQLERDEPNEDDEEHGEDDVLHKLSVDEDWGDE